MRLTLLTLWAVAVATTAGCAPSASAEDVDDASTAWTTRDDATGAVVATFADGVYYDDDHVLTISRPSESRVLVRVSSVPRRDRCWADSADRVDDTSVRWGGDRGCAFTTTRDGDDAIRVSGIRFDDGGTGRDARYVRRPADFLDGTWRGTYREFGAAAAADWGRRDRPVELDVSRSDGELRLSLRVDGREVFTDRRGAPYWPLDGVEIADATPACTFRVAPLRIEGRWVLTMGASRRSSDRCELEALIGFDLMRDAG